MRSSYVWAALALVFLSSSQALRAGKPVTSDEGDEQEALAVYNEGHAGEALEGTYDKAAPVVKKIIRRQSHVVIVDVGSNEGEFSRALYQQTNNPVQDALSAPNVRAFLIEPNPPVFEKLLANVQSTFNDTERVTPLELAVCANASADGQVPFYRVSHKFLDDNPVAMHFLRSELSSMNYSQVYRQLEKSCIPLFGCTLDKAAGGIAAYIEEIRVPCKTPQDLLTSLDTKAAVVDILKVDAEGLDASIVQAFLALSGFHPSVIIFEAKHVERASLAELVTALLKNGYHTNCRSEESKVNPNCSEDVLALSTETIRTYR